MESDAILSFIIRQQCIFLLLPHYFYINSDDKILRIWIKVYFLPDILYHTFEKSFIKPLFLKIYKVFFE